MFEICQLCKVLSNPLRLEILTHIYHTKEGFNFGLLVDKMQKSKLCASGVSQYLKELERLGIIRRRREGCYVNYYADHSRAPHAVAEITSLIVEYTRKNKNHNLTCAFQALMNPFRANVIRLLAQKSPLPAETICEKTNHFSKYLKRDLLPALKAGLITENATSGIYTTYSYVPPHDPILVCIMEHMLKSRG